MMTMMNNTMVLSDWHDDEQSAKLFNSLFIIKLIQIFEKLEPFSRFRFVTTAEKNERQL